MISLTVEPESGEAELLGKLVSELQTNVAVVNNAVTGTLKHVTGYTGFSGDEELQSGNYLALKVDADEDATVIVDLVGGSGEPVTLGDDRNIVVRITDKDAQKVRVTVKLDGRQETEEYKLTGLTLLEE